MRNRFSHEGEPGSPGQEGEPGTDGGGKGGTGGAGGKGGAGAKISKNRWIIGYLIILLIASGSAQLYTRSVSHKLNERQKEITRTLNHRDLISCQQRQVLARNQLDVFDALITARIRNPLLDPSHVTILRQDRERLIDAIAKGC